MPIFGNKNKNGNLAVNFAFADGIPGWNVGDATRIVLDDSNGCVSIESRLNLRPSVTLNYSQIVKAEQVSEQEVIEKSKSVIGRAIVGKLFFGNLGAQVGAISGTGKKEKTCTKQFFVINYHPKNDLDDIKAISFEIVGATMHFNKFIADLKAKLPAEVLVTSL